MKLLCSNFELWKLAILTFLYIFIFCRNIAIYIIAMLFYINIWQKIITSKFRENTLTKSSEATTTLTTNQLMVVSITVCIIWILYYYTGMLLVHYSMGWTFTDQIWDPELLLIYLLYGPLLRWESVMDFTIVWLADADLSFSFFPLINLIFKNLLWLTSDIFRSWYNW